MSAPAKQGGSRWGSFLQQAVAGIEQNLDNILSGDDVPQTHVKPAAPAVASKEAGMSASFIILNLSPLAQEASLTRSPSSDTT